MSSDNPTAAEKAQAAKARAKAKAEAAEAEAGTEAATADTTTTADKPKRRMPTYGLEVVDELPEEAPRRPGGGGGGGGRASQYLTLMQQILETPGRWVQVVEFQVGNGAVGALRAMLAGERQVPNGRWEIKALKITNPADPDGERLSRLYVKLHDADVDGVEFVNVDDKDKKWLDGYLARKAEKAAEGDADAAE